MHGYIDLGLSGCDSYEMHGAPLKAWDEAVLPGFGSYINQFGYMGNVEHIEVEVLPEDFGADGTYVTPMMEVSPDDYKYMEVVNTPYVGMRAISDLGDLYEYTEAAPPELGGRLKRFFKKVGRGIKKGVKKVGSGIKKGFKSLMHKTKFGKAILRIGSKIIEVSKKVILKLAKVVGKWATRLAPLAAMIPGYGPAIAGALLAAGAIANIILKVDGRVKKVNAIVDGKAGVVEALELTNTQAAKMTKELKLAAAKMSKRPKAEIDALNKKLRDTDPDAAGPSKMMSTIIAQKAALDAARAKARAKAMAKAGKPKAKGVSTRAAFMAAMAKRNAEVAKQKKMAQVRASMKRTTGGIRAGIMAAKAAQASKIAAQAARSRAAAAAAGAARRRAAAAAGARHAAQQRALETQRQAASRRGRPTIAKMQAAAEAKKQKQINALMQQLKKLGVQLPA